MNYDSFGRVVTLRVYATNFDMEGITPFIDYANGYTEFSSVEDSETGKGGFRIHGKCVLSQPTVGFNTNNIHISIYNLGLDSRAIIQSKVGTKIELFAGFGDNINQLALGDILWANTHKEGADYMTEIIAGDSHFALTNGKINTSFSGAVTYLQIINACADALAINNIFIGVIRGVPFGGYNNGRPLNGSPFEILSELCHKLNLSFSIVGGGIYILPIDEDLGTPVIELSVETGLIGIPELQPPGLIGVVPEGVPVTPDNNIFFTHLLRADLTLSQRVRISSKFINGDYILGRVTHDFDSWSGPFYSRCEAFAVLKPSSVNLNASQTITGTVV